MSGESEDIASGPTSPPPNFVAGVIDDRTDFELAVEDLVGAGVPRETLAIFHGERGAEAIAGRHGGGLMSWFRRAAGFLSDEHEYIDHYEEEARRGHFVVGVPLPDATDPTRERIRSILTKRAAHHVVSSTPWTHTGDA
jgi:hypothetical protein